MEKMAYLVNDNGSVRVFLNEEKMKIAGFKKADLVVPEEALNSNGGLTRIIEGKIIVGKTAAEIAKQEKQMQIAELKGKLEQIDQVSGASRQVRDVSVSAGVLLDAMRVLISRIATDLKISMPPGFGKGATNALEILALAPSADATNQEKEDFAVHKALLLFSHFDPTINPGLNIIREGEMKAMPIRLQLAELL